MCKNRYRPCYLLEKLIGAFANSVFDSIRMKEKIVGMNASVSDER